MEKFQGEGGAFLRHVNIPIFIPHMGCPNMCVFCNQRTISGKRSFDINTVRKEIENALETIDSNTTEAEIAFFGGSFTGIDRNLMSDLLSLANEYIRDGKAKGLRLSTRPDYIDKEILDILKRFNVLNIELGVQSMSDKVLTASKRGHTALDTERACRLIKSYGFNLVGQMMIGLPSSTLEDEVYTAKKLCELNVDAARIYPTAVLCGTELEDMLREGEYSPLTLSDAVERAAKVTMIFYKHNVPVIRTGLHASEDLFHEGGIVAGAFHSAFGELVQSRCFLESIEAKLKRLDTDFSGKTLHIKIPEKATSKVVGQKRQNIEKLISKYNFTRIKTVEKSTLKGFETDIEII